jgi:hypothetical protein
MKQLIVILLAAIAGGAGGYLISKSSHKCSSEQCKDCSKKTPAKPKVAKGLYQQASEKQMWYEVQNFLDLMNQASAKAVRKSTPVKVGGYINKYALKAAIESLPDSVKALKFHLGLNSRGNISLFFIGGLLKYPLVELATPPATEVSGSPLIITEAAYSDTDSTPVYCPPACGFPINLNAYPPAVIEPVIQPVEGTEEQEGSGGTE